MAPDELAVAREAGAHLPATLVADSSPLGWRDVLVRTYVDDRQAEPFATLATPDLLLVLVRSGVGVLEARGGSGWTRALYRAGVVGATVPGGSSTLRWTTTSPEPMTSTHVHLAGGLLEQTYAATGTRPELPDRLELCDPFVRESARQLAIASETAASALYAGALAQAVASHVVELARRGGSAGPPQPPGRGLDAAALRDVTAYMHAHVGDRVTLDDLAAVAHHSKHHFLRLFRASTGTTPHRALTEIRMDRAAQLLRGGTAPLATAHAVGYRSASQFAEAFRRAHGATPGVYQAAHRNPPVRRSEEPVVPPGG